MLAVESFGIIVQARMSSTRLPGKVLKSIQGIPLLGYQLQRLKKSGLKIVVATTLNPEDQKIVDLCNELNVATFRGSELDVLGRFAEAAKQNQILGVIRANADCPFLDGQLIRETVEKYHSIFGPGVYISNSHQRSYPKGFDFEIFSGVDLEVMNCEAKLEFEREHVTPFIWKSHPERFKTIHVVRSQDDSQFRITVDQQEDFDLIEDLIVNFKAHLLPAEEITQILKQNPRLSAYNAHVQQIKV